MKKGGKMEKVFKTHQDFVNRMESLRDSDKDLNAYVTKENGNRDKAYIKWLRDQGCSYSEIQEHIDKSKSSIAYHLKT